jgi:putative transposase
MRTAEVCRRHEISPATFYKWKAKYGGLEVSEAKRLRSLEHENAKLKKLLAEAMRIIAVLEDITAKMHVLSLSKGGAARRKARSGSPCSDRIWLRASCVLHHLSLRAKRGNPDSGAAGLPHFARNDDLHLLQCALSERRACGIIGVSRRVNSYASQRPDDGVLRVRLRDLAS